MRVFGLTGYPLSHSFSKKYFSEKFQREGIEDARYELFEIPDISGFPELFSSQLNLKGLNVTIPYKQQVLPFLDELDSSAQKVGAVNVIRKKDNKLIGYNSDYYGFRLSLEKWLGAKHSNISALVLGTGGASKAVIAALQDLKISYMLISRQQSEGVLTYEQLKQNPSLVKQHHLIINTSPVGMSPKTDQAPSLPYEHTGMDHYLYDLVYNPEETKFMQLGKEQGAQVKNGLEMLHLQAEKAWEIWNQN